MKILVVQQKMIGDVLTSSILFEALRKQYPKAELHYLIQPHTRAVVENNPYIDRVILFPPELSESPLRLWKFSLNLRKEDYDLVIDVYSKIGSAVMSWISGASTRLSYHKWYTSWLYSHTVERHQEPSSEAGLAIEHRLALLEPIKGSFPQVLRPVIYLEAQEIDAAREKLEDANVDLQQPIIMANILGSSPVKSYPLRYMAQLLDFAVQESQAQILFNYIPSQNAEARQVYEYCNQETQQRIFFGLLGSNLREFLAITTHCDALLGNEGGAINMAKALDIPTFAIFSPQIEKKTWSIFEDGHRNVSVHLEEFQSERLKGKSSGHLAKKSHDFYQNFEPHYIYPKLKKFLKVNIEKRP